MRPGTGSPGSGDLHADHRYLRQGNLKTHRRGCWKIDDSMALKNNLLKHYYILLELIYLLILPWLIFILSLSNDNLFYRDYCDLYN